MPSVTEWDAAPIPVHRQSPGHWVAVGLVLVAVLVLVAGAGRPMPLRASFTVTGQIKDVRAADDTLYVERLHGPHRTVVDAYGAPSGQQRWTREFGAGSHVVEVDDRRAILFATERPGQGSTLMAIDARDGRTVWRHPGYAPGVSAGEVMLGEPLPRSGDRPTSRRLVAIGKADGAVRWAVEVAEGTVTTYRMDPRDEAVLDVVEVDRDGALRVRDARSGAVRHGATLPLRGRVQDLVAVGGVLIVYGREDAGSGGTGTPDLPGQAGGPTVYDLHSGRLLWQRAADRHRVAPCGVVICSAGEADLRGLDPRTGHELWRMDGWRRGALIGPDHLAAVEAPANGDSAVGPSRIVEARTGRVVVELGAWRVVGGAAGSVLLRQHGAGGLGDVGLIARHDLGTGRWTVIGREYGWVSPPQCRWGAAFVACATSEHVSVWPTVRNRGGPAGL